MDSNFVDYVKIYCRSGKGGRGSMHLRHVKYQPNGGPDGGDGGHIMPIQESMFVTLLMMDRRCFC